MTAVTSGGEVSRWMVTEAVREPPELVAVHVGFAHSVSKLITTGGQLATNELWTSLIAQETETSSWCQPSESAAGETCAVITGGVTS
jgi:N-acetylglucosamine kinase-like BadF-type ATPase